MKFLKELKDDKVLSRYAVMMLSPGTSTEFDVSVTPADIIPENFNSAQALWAMVQRLQAE